MESSETPVTLDTLVALAKRRGFVYQSAEIYGGINGIYDTGPLGVALKRNLRKLWLASLRNTYGKIFEIEGALLAPEAVWKASGHIAGFHDPMVDCKACKRRFRADEFDLTTGCPVCGKNDWTAIRDFNMMFKTQVGAVEDGSSIAYLRPETAQAIFINFKNVLNSSRAKIPFGIAQIGKAFRNEITPKQFLFRMREFEQMELEWFCHPESALRMFEFWVQHRLAFYKTIGLTPEKIRTRAHEPHERAHYSTHAVDIEYLFPFGWKEIEGIAHRGAFDLTQHSQHSGKELAVFDEETKNSYIPHVIEPSVGTDRLLLTVLFDSYHEDIVENEKRVVLKLHPALAPITVAVLQLTKKLSPAAELLYNQLQQEAITCDFDESGSIGKRYRRHDEIGTPFCITYDFESEQDHCVTIRDRDTTKQERLAIDAVSAYIRKHVL